MASINDYFADADVFGITPGSSGTSADYSDGNTVEDGEPAPFAGTGGRSVWYYFPAYTAGSVLRINGAVPTVDSVIDVFTGTDLSSLVRVAGRVVLTTDPDPGLAHASPYNLSVDGSVPHYARLDVYSTDGVYVLRWGWDTTPDPGELPHPGGWTLGYLPIG